MPNVTIGPNSVVGACSVVTKDVPPDSVYAGNPAKFICTSDDYKKKLFSIWNIQKPKNYLSDFKDNTYYSPKSIEKAKRRDMDLLVVQLKRIYCEKSSNSLNNRKKTDSDL